MSAILGRERFTLDQPLARHVHQFGAREPGLPASPVDQALRKPPQVRLDQAEELVHRRPVALVGATQQRGDDARSDPAILHGEDGTPDSAHARVPRSVSERG